MRRARAAFAAIAFLGLAAATLPAPAADVAQADRILVLKGARRLELLRAGEVLRSYAIRLGPNPIGPKIFEYDGRTPEGDYVIDRRSRSRRYHLALHISYPQAANRARAAKYGLPPGGGVFIHGTPGTGNRFQRDWTDGCIAVSDRAIEEIWRRVKVGTPIEIRP